MVVIVGNARRVNRRSAPTDLRLRRMLKAGRRASGNLSQKDAARLTGISPVYWQKIESGKQPSAPADTLAMMFLTLGIPATTLRDAGYPDVAEAADEIKAAQPAEQSPEDYLAGTPGASPAEIGTLQAVWRALKAGRTAEPIEPDFTQHDRRNQT